MEDTHAMSHEQLEYTVGVSPRGYQVVIWHCTCGRHGKGSLTTAEARAGWIKHARGRAMQAAGMTRVRRSR